MSVRAIAPLRDEALSEEGMATLTAQTFFEDVAACLDSLTPSDKELSFSDSPYQALPGQCLLADMDLGSISILVPINGGEFCVSRKHTTGSANALTIIGTVNGEVDPEILFNGSTASMRYMTEWRYV